MKRRKKNCIRYGIISDRMICGPDGATNKIQGMVLGWFMPGIYTQYIKKKREIYLIYRKYFTAGGFRLLSTMDRGGVGRLLGTATIT